jgi:predicted SAM-dependent methyltransferase
MRINGMLYRIARQPNEPIQVYLGCGQVHYIPGWVNVDANIFSARPDVWANLLDPLPFRKSSVKMLYSHHMIEHLPDRFFARHFRDMYECLIPGGGIRVGGPDIGNACRKFMEGDLDWFSSMMPIPRQSLGGKIHEFRLLWRRTLDGSFGELPARTRYRCGLRRHMPLLSCS